MENRVFSSRKRKAALALVFAVFFPFANIYATPATGGGANACLAAPLDVISHGRPYLLNDPRSGLMLYLESDGRHMSAITRAGKIVWHRNLFDDERKLGVLYTPPLPVVNELRISDSKWRQRMRDYIGSLTIDRIGIASDCEVQAIDHEYSSKLFRRHYISAASGMKIGYLIDAETGDLLVGDTN